MADDHGAEADFSRDMRDVLEDRDATSELLASVPAELEQWSPLAQDQYFELRTLLAGYLLPSQGDRMLMANSIEGRFPFLDANLVALAHSLPDAYKLHVLDEKHILKAVARDLVPRAIVVRKKQPYRAPDAMAFVQPQTPQWVSEMLSDESIRAVGAFDPVAVARLREKLRARASDTAPFSNGDNMAVVGILSTQLLHEQLIRRAPAVVAAAPKTLIERIDP